ncbi:MAG: BamA/TamA family outer membrane protein, partial [Thermodesulfovibrionales bacterium]|nr:BamA/TamA family outer membrane protein [Thermodesulfovibrionales bacterium]
VQATASAGIKEQEGTRTTSSISPSLTRDTRDNFLDPHTGSQNGVYLTYAGIGGSNKFFKSIAESIWYFPVSEMTTFSVRGNYGYAVGLYGEKLPLYERFYVGGMYSLRGLGFGEAGPKDENGVVTGGTKKVIFNAEYTFPLIPAARLKGVMFYDLGTSYDDNSDIRFRKTAGCGIRWISPIGPLRLEWGRNLDRRPGETEGRWEFTFGTFF